MTTQTQATLLTQVRSKLNSVSTNRFTDVQIRTWINDGIQDITRRAESNRTTSTISVTAGTQEYTGPTDAVRIHQVSYIPTGQTQEYDLQYQDVKNVSSIAWTSVSQSTGTPAIFWTWGYPPNLKINLYPTPSISGNLKVWYYKLPVPLATDGSAASTNVDVPQGWEVAIVDHAVYQALLSDADERWSIYKQIYEETLAALTDAAIRFIDQSGMISTGTSMIPSWLYAFDD